MAKLTPWSEFMAAVEGRVDARPMAVVDGLPTFTEDAPAPKPVPNLLLLSALLRGGALLPPDVRSWLADLFDPDAAGLMRVAGLVKRREGPMPGPVLKHSAAVETFRAALDSGRHRKGALGDTMQAHWIGKTTLEKAIADQEAAEEEHARAARDD